MPNARCSATDGGDCRGVAVYQDRCVGHLNDGALTAYVAQLGPYQNLDARGAPIDGARCTELSRFLKAAESTISSTFRGALFTGYADFTGAQFTGGTDFGGAQFASRADFTGAQFLAPWRADFSGALFTYRSDFNGANFEGHVDFSGAQFTKRADFSGAQFTFSSDFSEARFDGHADFGSAQFTNRANFRGAEFTSGANFRGAQFADHAGFREARFTSNASFGPALFAGSVDFGAAQFAGHADFGAAQFAGHADFGGAQFNGTPGMRLRAFVDFVEVELDGLAQFTSAHFDGNASFRDVQFTVVADFSAASFRRRCELGPLRATHLSLTGAEFEGPAEIHAACPDIRADGIRSREGMTLTAREADISLRGARFAAPATIAASPAKRHVPAQIADEATENDSRDRAEDHRTEDHRTGNDRIEDLHGPARLLTTQGSDLTNVTLAGLDLSACRFVGAYNLDKVRINGPALFATTPDGRWTPRITLAEEHEWRVKYDRRSDGWYRPELGAADRELPDHVRGDHRTSAARAEASRVQAAYRELRKSLEDAKDEPGAADFYYGEMEMRRLASRATAHGRDPFHLEYGLLTAYWAVSGYGLRAGRAILALLLVATLATVGFATIGLGHGQQTVYLPVTSRTAANGPVPYRQTSVRGDKPGAREAAYYSIESATSLLREPTTEPLTASGRFFEATLRLIGPLLLGLALLAVRGRVKR
jgi:hypothetical protein